MVKVPRPKARAKKPGIAARAVVEYLIFATAIFYFFLKTKERG